MPTETLLRPNQLALQSQAEQVVEDLRDHDTFYVQFVVNGRRVRAGRDLSAFLATLVDQLADNGTVGLVSLPEELTTTTAAEQLGISRPTLMKLIRRNEIPSHKVGTHTRILTKDLLEYRERKMAARRQAASNLREIEIDHEIID